MERSFSRSTVHGGCVFYLLLVLWAEPEASRALPLTPTTGVDMKDMRSVSSNLFRALNLVIRDLNKTHVKHLRSPNCSEAAAQLEQIPAVVANLSQHQSCALRLQSLSTNNLCLAVELNKDLLEHLGSDVTDFSGCPPQPASVPTDFESLNSLVKCVLCWIQQVAALLPVSHSSTG